MQFIAFTVRIKGTQLSENGCKMEVQVALSFTCHHLDIWLANCSNQLSNSVSNTAH